MESSFPLISAIVLSRPVRDWTGLGACKPTVSFRYRRRGRKRHTGRPFILLGLFELRERRISASEQEEVRLSFRRLANDSELKCSINGEY